MENYFMGLDGFIWFTGVVEDRNDPSQLGRVKVRCLGYHTEDLNSIPTKDLPWAHVMHPVTDPSMQGLGCSPSFLVEGSWVVGFFRDAREKQQPIIMGTIPGYPENSSDTSKGFNDPNGKYPSSQIEHSGHSTKESDTSRLAQGSVSETHFSLLNRRVRRNVDIPTAGKPGLNNSLEFSTAVANGKWSEPHPKSALSDQSPYPSAQYPLNHVQESESGHIFEIDDTPDNERLYREHMSGTFEEIHPQGTRVTKVVFDDYEIVMKNKKIVINASNQAEGLDLTVYGSVKQYVTGDYILDIGGNFIRRVGKSEVVKVGAKGSGNLETEIVNGSYNLSVDKNYIATIGQVGGDMTTTVSGSETRTIGGTQDIYVTSDIFVASTEASVIFSATTDMSINGLDSLNLVSGGTTSFGSVDAVTMNFEDALSVTAGTTTESYGSLTTGISGVTVVNYTGDATFKFASAYKRKIDGDTFFDAKGDGDLTDHIHPVSPARATGTDAVT